MFCVQLFNKRLFDIFFSLLGIVILLPIIILVFILACIDTNSFGLFFQTRVGRFGHFFKIYKIKTMIDVNDTSSTISASNDPRITKFGSILRKTKLDELPQLFNILFGNMSFVGPRPDVPGYADLLPESKRIIVLSVRPGITGPASIAFKDEEYLLASIEDPKMYNDEVIFPEKVRLNILYVENMNFWTDLKYIFVTLRGSL